MLTTKRAFNLDEDLNIKRIIELTKISAITKRNGSNVRGLFDFVVHVEGEYDYLFYSKKREQIVKKLKACYFNLTNVNIPIYEVHGKVERHRSTKDE